MLCTICSTALLLSNLAAGEKNALRFANAFKKVASVVFSKIASVSSALVTGATCDVEDELRDTYLARFLEFFDSLAQGSSADVVDLWLTGPLSFGVFHAVGSHGSQYFWAGGYRHLASRTNRRLLEFESALTSRNLDFARAQSRKYHSILLRQRDTVQKSSWDHWWYERKIC